MSSEPVYVVDILKEVVQRVSDKLQQSLGKPVGFMNGSPEEIEANLVELTKLQGFENGKQKYPLIALFHDFPEDRGDSGGYYGSVTLPKVIIVTMSAKTYKADKRYDVSFRPVIYPIYYEFLNQITKHRNLVVSDANSIRHTKYDRLDWGTDSASKQLLTDYLDGIEVANLRLLLQQNCKCKKSKYDGN